MKRFKSAKITACFFALLVFLLVLNIVYLGATGKHFISGENISDFAERRGKKSVVDYATRGQIYTNDNEVVASNVKKYKMIAILSSSRPGYGSKEAHVVDLEDAANKIAPIIGCEVNDLLQPMTKAKEENKYQIEFGSVGRDLTTTQKAQIEELGLTGIEFDEYNGRFYPYGDFCSYMIGYTNSYEGEGGVQMLVGQMGMELKKDKTLSGKNGFKVYQTDASGYTLPNGVLESEDSSNGQDLYLTINSSLQRDLDSLMAEALEGTNAEWGTAAVMEAKTGKILAVSSVPSFDPNNRKIENYTNYFTDATFECGSVFKPFIYATSIQSGTYSHTATYNSGVYPVYAGGRNIANIRDHNNGQGWGTINYDVGLFHSSNVAICNMLENGMVDKETLKDNLAKLGFFIADDIDGIATAKGIAAYQNSDSRLGYLTTGFGQGSTMTAYQLLKAYSVFANDGKTVEPYIVDRIVNIDNNKVTYTGKTEYSEQIFSSDTISQMKDLLLGVVEDPAGTGKIYKMDNTRLIGKTGTGQISDGRGYRSDIAMHSFAGLAPYDDPEVVVFITLRCGNEYAQYTPKIIKTIVPEAIQIINSYNGSIDDQIITSPTFELDSYTNQSVNYVKSKLESKGLIVETIGNGSTVMDQSIASNTVVSQGDRLFLRTDYTEIPIPDMTGYSRKDATTFASLAGLNITFDGQSGSVVAQSIPTATVVAPGSEIIVKIE